MLKKKDPILKISTRVYYNAFKNKTKRLEGKYKYAKNTDYITSYHGFSSQPNKLHSLF